MGSQLYSLKEWVRAERRFDSVGVEADAAAAFLRATMLSSWQKVSCHLVLLGESPHFRFLLR